MRQEKESQKAELMKKAEELIEEMLEWQEKVGKANLGQIEEEILEIREKLGQEMLASVVKHQEEGQEVPGPKCAECSQEMKYKGQKKKQVETMAGGVGLERAYYYCPNCKVGLFPPG